MNLWSRWNRFWFAPAPAADLAVGRFLFFTGFFAFSLTRAFHEWAEVPDFLHAFRARYLVWLAVPVPGTLPLMGIEWLWRLAIFMAAIGLLTRPACFAAGFGSLYLMGLDAPDVAGRSYTAGVFVPLILGVSRCGDVLSVDAWIRRRRGRDVAGPPEEYGWPVRLVCAFLSCIFFAAGVAKVRFGGFPDWMLSDTIRHAILQGGYWYTSRGRPATDLGPWLLQWHPMSTVIIGVVAQVAELLYPAALFSGRARWVLVPVMGALLVGFWLCMGPFFFLTLLAHVFWVPWSALWRRMGSGRNIVEIRPRPSRDPAGQPG
ncbi:MAG: hypothetical protein KF791_00500 [Verrucomicrobiae bacterium]|nr:hypothetical protein [Verrucomicrobiae bacterium]